MERTSEVELGTREIQILRFPLFLHQIKKNWQLRKLSDWKIDSGTTNQIWSFPMFFLFVCICLIFTAVQQICIEILFWVELLPFSKTLYLFCLLLEDPWTKLLTLRYLKQTYLEYPLLELCIYIWFWEYRFNTS